MPSTRVVMAGTGFAAVRQFLIEALPDAQLDQVEVATLRAKGHAADVMLPAMSRIDGALMDRYRGPAPHPAMGRGSRGRRYCGGDRAQNCGRQCAHAGHRECGVGRGVVVMAAIAISRRLPLAQETIRTGGTWGTPLGRALMGRTAGIVGLGGIGQALASRLRPFGMRVVGLQRQPASALAERLGMEWVGGPERLAELLRRSDYLFLCVPLSEQTRQIIDEAALAMLPPQACIINAARGGLLSTGAMLRALAEGSLIGAGLDVFEQEPLDPPHLCSAALTSSPPPTLPG